MYVGTLVSLLFCMIFEEKIGKRKILITNFFLASIGGLLLSISNSIIMIIISQFIIGLGIFVPVKYGIAIISDLT